MKKTYILAIGLCLTVLLSGCSADAPEVENDPTISANREGDLVEAEQSGQIDQSQDQLDSSALSNSNGQYLDYDEAAVRLAAENGRAVLFFHASWCPFCREADEDIKARLSEIPSGLSIFKVDYDKEVELKKKYSVVAQHTFVQVDKDLNLIKAWNSGKLKEIAENIE